MNRGLFGPASGKLDLRERRFRLRRPRWVAGEFGRESCGLAGRALGELQQVIVPELDPQPRCFQRQTRQRLALDGR